MASFSKARKMGLVSVVALVYVCLADISLVLGDAEGPGDGGFMEHHSTDVGSDGEGMGLEDGVAEGGGSSGGGGEAGGILNAVRRLLGSKAGVRDAAGAGNRRLLANEGGALSDSFVEDEGEEGGNSTSDEEQGGQSDRRLSVEDEEEEEEGGNSTADEEQGGQSGRRLSIEEGEDGGEDRGASGSVTSRRLSEEGASLDPGFNIGSIIARAIAESTTKHTLPNSSFGGGGGDHVVDHKRPSMGLPKPLPMGDPKNSSSVEPSAEEASKRTREAAKLLGEAMTLFLQNLGDLIMKSAEVPREGAAGVVDAIIGGVNDGSEKLKQVASQMGSSINDAMGKWYLEFLRRMTRSNPEIVFQAMRILNMLKNVQGEVAEYGDQITGRTTAAVHKTKREVDDTLG